MIILLLFACAACASLTLAGHGSIVALAWLVVATGVAIILVVAVMPMLDVVFQACLWWCILVAWIGTALFVQVLSIFAVHVTGLEILVRALVGTLLVILLVVVASPTIMKLGVLSSTLALTMIAVINLWLLRWLARWRSLQAYHSTNTWSLVGGEMAQLAHVSLHQLLMQLMICFCTNLLDPMAL